MPVHACSHLYLTVAKNACMMGYMTDAQRVELEAALVRWAENNSGRDELVRSAVAAGISKHRVHILTGLARTTVDTIVSRAPE